MENGKRYLKRPQYPTVWTSWNAGNLSVNSGETHKVPLSVGQERPTRTQYTIYRQSDAPHSFKPHRKG